MWELIDELEICADYLADVIVATTVLAVLIGLVLVRYRVLMRG